MCIVCLSVCLCREVRRSVVCLGTGARVLWATTWEPNSESSLLALESLPVLNGISLRKSEVEHDFFLRRGILLCCLDWHQIHIPFACSSWVVELWLCAPSLGSKSPTIFLSLHFLTFIPFFFKIILLSSIEVFWIASSIEIWRDSVCFKRTFSALSGKLEWNSRICLLLSKIKSTSWFNSSQHTFTKHDVQITGI